jgi:hypothetical protein
LTTLFGNRDVSTLSAAEIPAAAKKQGWLPLLTVLFLISYGLMTMLIVEQGRTIESQRTLIRDLFRDNTELSTLRTRAQQQQFAQMPATRTQLPTTQAPNTQAPSSQAGPQGRVPNAAAKKKSQFRMPSKPQPDLVDDVRTLIAI